LINRKINEFINKTCEKLIDDFWKCHEVNLDSYEGELIEYFKDVAEISYGYGFSEPHTDDEEPCTNPYISIGLYCSVDMNIWDY